MKYRFFSLNKGFFAKESNVVKLLFTLVMAIYFSFGFYHLADFISADEHFWLPNSGSERIEKYWEAVADGKWKDTRINDKPGITLAYTSGIALLFEKDIKTQIIKSNGTYKQFNPEKTKEINFAFRLPILILSGLFSLYFFWIIRKITENDWIALFSIAGIYLSPILIGMSQIVNPDSLFWIFASASFFAFFAFLQKEEKRFAIHSAIFLGLALASKYVSVIFFPFFFLMMLGYYLFYAEDLNREEFAKKIIRNGIWYLSILAIAMLIFAIMMPASFVEPKYFYEGTIGFPGMSKIFWMVMALNIATIIDAYFLKSKGFHWALIKMQILKKYLPIFLYIILSLTFVFVLVNWITRHGLLDLSNIPFDAKRRDSFGDLPFYKKYIMEYVALVFSLTPVVLFSVLFIWIKSIFKPSRFSLLVFLLSSFYLVFYAAVIIQGLLVTTRYSIILYPFSMVLASIAIYEFLLMAKTKSNVKTLITFGVVFVGIIFLQVFSLFQQYTIRLRTKAFIDTYGSSYFISIPVIIAVVFLVIFLIRKYVPWSVLGKITFAKAFIFYAILNIVSIIWITPFYFSYTNDLLPKKYIISGAWGYGGYEAAQYLNGLPDAQNLTLWADAYGVCEFFVGKCIHKAKVNTQKYPIDYYFQSLQSTIGMNFPHPMEKKEVWRMTIDNRGKSFLKIRKAKPAGYQTTLQDLVEEQLSEEQE